MSALRHVYLAYAPEDADFAALLADDLSRDEFRTCGNHVPHTAAEAGEEVDIAIREALAVVAILSPVSARSALVSYEWAFALGSGVPVLPVLLDIAEADLHPRLRTLQYLDFSNRSDRPWRLLKQSLHKLEGAQRPTTVHVPRDAPPVIQQAAGALDATNEATRAAALASLGQMNHPAVLAVLADAVRHPVQQVRCGAAIHLAAHRDARAVPALLEGIRGGVAAVEPWMLGNVGPSAVPALLAALCDENQNVQDAVASQLGRIGSPEAIAALIEILRDPDATKRRRAAYGLSYAADAGAIPALLEAVHDTERGVRNSAVDALVKCAAKAPSYDGVLPALIEALDDEYDQVAINATEGLAMTRDARGIAALVQAAVTSPQQQVRVFSSRALKKIGALAAAELRAATSSQDARTLDRALDLLKEIGDENDFPFFIEATRHEDPDVRNTAVLALWDHGVKQGVPALIERLNDDDDHIRKMAARALAALRDPRAIPALVQCLDDAEEEFVGKAAHALAEIGTREARTALKVWKRQRKK